MSDEKSHGELVFALNGKRVAIKAENVDPQMTLNEYIREHTSFKGTKIACGEGGCGACVVALAKWDPIHKKVVEGPANSCLRLLASCDGWSVTTVEGLGNSVSGFHPIQERVAGFHGTQCGYCTPGMVMAIYSNFKYFDVQGGKNLTMKQAESFLDGNICRCTGYRPILDAVKSFAADSDVKDLITKTTATGPYDTSKDPNFPEFLKSHSFHDLAFVSKSGVVWHRPTTLANLFSLLHKAKEEKKSVKLVVGNTAVGIYKKDQHHVLVDVQAISELRETSSSTEGVTVGAASSISDLIAALLHAQHEQKDPSKVASFDGLIQHALRVASFNVRNVGSIAGNLFLTKTKGFLSDLATILVGASTIVTIASSSGSYQTKKDVPLHTWLSEPEWNQSDVLYSITIPWTQPGDIYKTYKAALRPQNAHAIVNAAFLFNVKDKKINKAVLAFGGIMEWDVKGSHPVRATATEKFLENKTLDNSTLKEALAVLKKEIIPKGELEAYRHRLVTGFFFKFFLSALGGDLSKHQSATEGTYNRSVSSGSQEFVVDEKDKDPAFKAIHKVEGKIQASGEARYVADTPKEVGYTHGVYVLSTVASGKILSINYEKALKQPGVVDVITAKDVPGLNAYPKLIWPLVATPFIAIDNVDYYGQPVALIVAETRRQGEAALPYVEVKYEQAEPIVTVEEASEKKFTYGFPMVHQVKTGGDVKELLEKDAHKISGKVTLGSQKHFYMETQCAYAVPEDEGILSIYTPSQFHGGITENVALALKIPQSRVNSILRRAGGSFGGKAVQSFLHACNASVAAWKVKRPVLISLTRNEDMMMTGGREETDQTYEVAFNDKGRISAVKHEVHLGGGANPDLSFFVMMVVNANFSQVYSLPNAELVSHVWKSNVAPRTAVRGPGEVAASYMIENIIAQIAHRLGLTQEQVREINFFDEKEKEPKTAAGKKLVNWTFPQMWDKLKKKVKYSERLEAVQKYNKENRWKKRGVAMTPVNYGVSVGSKDALVNIGNDGSVVVHHTGCEMGQGLNTKVAQIAASTLGSVLGSPIDIKLIRFADMNSTVIPNGRGTGGSTGSEATVAAVRMACQALVSRLKRVQEALIAEAEAKAKKAEEDAKEGKAPASEGKEAFKLTWETLCRAADSKSVDLSAKAKYSDDQHPEESFNYNNYGACFSEVEVDVLTGETNVLESNLIYDCGKSLNPAIDIGQIEGAYVMGLGAVLRERESFTKDGKLLTDGTWNYKPPGVKDIPIRFVVEMIQNESFEKGILSSKASGEPPLVLAISVAMAVRFAIQSARDDAGLKDWVRLDLPLTPEVIQAACGVSDKDISLE